MKKEIIILAAILLVFGVVVIQNNDSEQVINGTEYSIIQEQPVSEQHDAPVIHDVIGQIGDVLFN